MVGACAAAGAPWWASASAADVWASARAAWPPAFASMFEPGAPTADFDAAEARLGVALPRRARELLSACCGAGLPAAGPSEFCAEACLLGPASWGRPGQDVADAFEWDASTLADHVCIGFNPEGADYCEPVLLRLSTCEAFGVILNIPELKPLGRLDEWIANTRPAGCGDPWSMYIEDPEETTPEALAEAHGDYLGWAPEGVDAAARAARWAAGQDRQFADALRACRGGGGGGGAA